MFNNQEVVQRFYDWPQQEASHKNYHKTKQLIPFIIILQPIAACLDVSVCLTDNFLPARCLDGRARPYSAAL